MTLPVIQPVGGIGKYRPLCEHSVHVAGVETAESRRTAWRRKQIGVPIDQCGARSDFTVDGKPMCRTHAGHVALSALTATPPVDQSPSVLTHLVHLIASGTGEAELAAIDVVMAAWREVVVDLPPTAADIEAARSPKGGWTRETLAAWGVPWPPPPGWRRALIEKGQGNG